MKSNQEQFRKWMRSMGRFFRRNGAICAAGVCALMVGAVFVLASVRSGQEEPSVPTIPAPTAVMAAQQAVQATTAPTASVNLAVEAAAQVASQGSTFMLWPVKGDVQVGFAKDRLVFQPTLGQWSVHPALDIQAQPEAEVVAAMQGRVETVREDKMLGKTVVVLHEDGWRSYYCSLKSVDVTVGDTLKAGQKLGTVGQTALEEINQGTHLHFALEKDGETVDPLRYLPAQ